MDIDERVLDLARGRARQRGITLGQAVSELALAGASSEGGADEPRLERDPLTGLLYFPAVPGHVITPELIAEVEDEMDEEAARALRDS